MFKYWRVFLIPLFILFASSKTHAQYQSIFGQQQTAWTMNSWLITPESIDCNPDSSWIVYGQDSTFSGNLFKQLMGNSLYDTVPRIRGYVREDTSSGEVWFRDNSSIDTNIYKIMDMSLAINDSFRLDFGILGSQLVPVDSIYYLNSKKVIQLDYSKTLATNTAYPLVKYTMIEGVGVNHSGVQNDVLNAILTKHWQNNALNYSANLDSTFDCQLSTSLQSITSAQEDITLYPNPLKDRARLSNSAKIERLSLFDTKGRAVSEFRADGSYLDFSEVRNGLYFLRIESRGSIETVKVIVNR